MSMFVNRAKARLVLRNCRRNRRSREGQLSYSRLGQVSVGLAISSLILTTSVVSWGQTTPSPGPSPSPKPTSSSESSSLVRQDSPLAKLQLPGALTLPNSQNSSDIAVGDVRLDGRKLFAIAAPAVRNQTNQTTGTPPIKDRIEGIEATLNRIVNSQFDPQKLSVEASVDGQTGLPVISVNDNYVMTVTTLDAQLQGQNPQRWADELRRIIREALLRAQQERQPDFLKRQCLVTTEMLLAMVLASWVIARTQRRLQSQQQTLNAQLAASSDLAPDTVDPTDSTAIATVQTQMNRRQRRNLTEVQQRLLQLLQLSIWGGGSFIMLGLFPSSRWLQPLILSGPVKVLGIALATYVAIRISDVLIDRSFTVLTANQFINADTSQRLALRVSTFSRVLRSVIGLLFISTGVLSVLSVIGVELGPVLAGAGILGLAISFASQNLIKDVINGLLILAEDQYAVGDVIQVGKVSGLVESMNLRITQLRNAEGRLITIPNSSIAVVENLSKDWSRVDLAITIAYDADVDRALMVIRQVGEAMDRDPDWERKIVEPPEVLGVDEIGNAGITIRIWIKTLPLEQWRIAREFRRRLKLALDAEGIAIGVPQQQSLWFRNPPNSQDTEAEAADNGRQAEHPSQSHTD